jgi:hypothetical protein
MGCPKTGFHFQPRFSGNINILQHDRAWHWVRRRPARIRERNRWQRGFAMVGATSVFLAFVSILQPVLAQTTPTALRVVTFVAPPFVIEHGDKLTGFSIDVWDNCRTTEHEDGLRESAQPWSRI